MKISTFISLAALTLWSSYIYADYKLHLKHKNEHLSL
jgi:hypothetical protein